MSIKKCCELLDITRSTLYYKIMRTNEVSIINEMREIYEQWPFYGYRRIHVVLRQRGMIINRKRVQRLMKIAGIKAVYSVPKTSVNNQEHVVYKYLLKDLAITRSDQVWQVDITYIKIRHGFVYLVCLIDVFSRRIMGWNLSTFLDTDSCQQALYNALLNCKPEILNSDQGCQFTSEKWISCLIKNDIQISMDGKGRWADNVHVERLWKTIKYESIFLHSFDTVQQARNTLAEYIEFYNNERPHQALNYHTPSVIHDLNKIPSKQDLFDSFINLNRKDSYMIPKLA